jgi:manganese/iron transport system permease protein
MRALLDAAYDRALAVGTPIVDALIALLLLPIALMPAPVAEAFGYAFMQRALLSAVLVGAVCGVLSCLVILKRWSLLGDTISHAVLPGVAIAYLAGWPFFIGAFLAGALTSLGIGLIERNSRIKEDAAMGIMLTGAFALGIVIISQIATSTHLMHILFGNVLGVRLPTLLTTLVSGIVALGFVLALYKELALYVFDPVQASTQGIDTRVMHYGLILVVTLMIVASLETVGIILVVAMLITPGATAYLLVDSLPRMMALAALIGALSGVIGLYLAFTYNVASGGTIVVVATGLFLLAFLFAPSRGLVWRLARRAA